MDCTEIEKLIRLVDRSSLKEFYYKTEDEEIRLVRQDTGVPAVMPISVPQPVIPCTVPLAAQDPETDAEARTTGGVSVRSPYVGAVNLIGENGKPFVSVGDSVTKGQLLCKIEAMKMFNDLTSPVDGIVRKILAEDGEMAEFDTVLFEIEEQA